mmetsp:Transcript_17026/g.43382  ORF Transcript_17026/g.43382 Transcript_17026/m.43382 type:complete len:145 (-) Transcript_17026:169-603(-)
MAQVCGHGLTAVNSSYFTLTMGGSACCVKIAAEGEEEDSSRPPAGVWNFERPESSRCVTESSQGVTPRGMWASADIPHFSREQVFGGTVRGKMVVEHELASHPEVHRAVLGDTALAGGSTGLFIHDACSRTIAALRSFDCKPKK